MAESDFGLGALVAGVTRAVPRPWQYCDVADVLEESEPSVYSIRFGATWQVCLQNGLSCSAGGSPTIVRGQYYVQELDDIFLPMVKRALEPLIREERLCRDDPGSILAHAIDSNGMNMLSDGPVYRFGGDFLSYNRFRRVLLEEFSGETSRAITVSNMLYAVGFPRGISFLSATGTKRALGNALKACGEGPNLGVNALGGSIEAPVALLIRRDKFVGTKIYREVPREF